jgi:hypothetical protein
MAGGFFKSVFSNLAGQNREGQEAGEFNASDLLGLNEKLPTNTVYRENRGGVADTEGKTARKIEGTESIFNPFYIFRYAKFGAIGGETYDVNLHRNIKPVAGSGVSTTTISFFEDKKDRVENPSASVIIDWSQTVTDNSKKGTLLGPTPYQWSDFLWCKWYGKIPNNRLLTLRRYPIPVEDNLQVAESKMPLVPIAQAVTWWGGETDNSLSSILGITYGFKWTEISFGEVQDVQGNEVEASAVLDSFGLTAKNTGPLREVLLASVFDNPNNPHAATGWDKELKAWIEEAYGTEGPYWNRVLGPVNVVENTQTRARGFDFTNDITLNFTYKLRGYSRINPKVAFLDLISNFLSLTHNNAEFYGGAIRYFQKTGYIVPGLNTAKFENGDFVGGIVDNLSRLYAEVNNKLNDLNGFVKRLTDQGLSQEDAINALKEAGSSRTVQNIAGSWVKNLMQKPLQMRTFLDGRAVGEWHLTVGNPMDPIAVIGNLCVKQTTISFSESLGLDDFPTEVSFKVSLVHGRDRAKQDILSMFNHGGGSTTFSDLPPTSSSFNSYGDRNSIFLNNYYKNTAIPEPGDSPNKIVSPQNVSGVVKGDLQQVIIDASTSGFGQFSVGSNNLNLEDSAEFAKKYSRRVERAYGKGYASSPILVDYFRDLKTKD